MPQVTVEYKQKIKKFVGGREYLTLKKEFGRKDLVQGRFPNHDFGKGILLVSIKDFLGIPKDLFGETKYLFLDDLPEGVTVNRDGFLAVVSITLEINHPLWY